MWHEQTPRVALGVALAVAAAFGDIGGQPTAGADPANTCVQGFVWRAARPGDAVCVSPGVRDTTALENQLAAQRVDPHGGPYGPDTCLQGFVWREAFAGDHVCVPPDSRTQAASDNAAAPSRVAVSATDCLPNPAPGLIPSGTGMLC
ncbi:hypothetical protein [Mycolicibacterium sp. HS_4_1]